MQCFSGFIFIVLCTIASVANAAHQPHLRRYNHEHHHSHTGYPTGLPDSTGGPFPFPSGSGAPLVRLSIAPTSVPYPARNATSGFSTCTSGVYPSLNLNGVSTTIHSTISSDVFVTAAPAPASTGSASPSSVVAPELIGKPGSGPAGTPGSTSDDFGGTGGGASTCGAQMTFTITLDTTVTITAPATPSQAPIEPQAPVYSPAPAPYSTGNGVSAGPISSGSLFPYRATTSSTPVVTPSQAAISAPASSVAVSAPQFPATPSSSSSGASSISSSVMSSDTSSASPTSASGTTSGSSSLTPNGIKAGVAGYVSITEKSAWNLFTSHIGWYSDYWPNTTDSGSVTGVPMLWGDGHQGGGDADRLAAFKALTTTPKYMMGFYEPDWTPPDSSDISSTSAASTWSSLIAPLGAKGTLLGSPSLATQYSESWLTPFANAPEKPTWDYTCIHTNKNSSQGVKEDVEYYLAKYKKPIWVSEFACVDDADWTPCTDQSEINTFIQEVVEFFQGNDSVVAYGFSNGDGLGDVWPMIDSTSGAITPSGQAYLSAIQAFH